VPAETDSSYWAWFAIAAFVAAIHLVGRRIRVDDRKILERIVSRDRPRAFHWLVGSVLLAVGGIALVAGSMGHGIGLIVFGAVALVAAIDTRRRTRMARQRLSEINANIQEVLARSDHA
jgi:hypothetical protein